MEVSKSVCRSGVTELHNNIFWPNFIELTKRNERSDVAVHESQQKKFPVLFSFQ